MPDTPIADKNDITDNSRDFEFEAIPAVEEIPVNYTGRIKMLMAGIVIAIIAYTGVWFWVGSQVAGWAVGGG